MPNKTVTSTKVNSRVASAKSFISEFTHALWDTAELLFYWKGIRDPNALHYQLTARYEAIPHDQPRVTNLTYFRPRWKNGRFHLFEEIVGIANCPMIMHLLERPRYENNTNYYDNHPDAPRVGGGDPFNEVLKAAGMGILSEDGELHAKFIFEMHQLTFDYHKTYAEGSFQALCISNIKKQVGLFIKEVKENTNTGKQVSYDFLPYALRILLPSFYPTGHWDDDFINGLANAITIYSDRAFQCIMNPYLSKADLKRDTDAAFEPFVCELLKHKPTYLRTKFYEEYKNSDVLKQIITSLLFAGGDNIKKYLDHVLVMFGKESVRTQFLQQPITSEFLDDCIREVTRLKTIIFAQPGVALDSFMLEYEGREYFIPEGANIHLSTYAALTDPYEWGEKFNEFDPIAHKEKHKELNAELTFGAKRRHCKGKVLSTIVVKETVGALLDTAEWTSYLNNNPDHNHETEFNFNNSLKEKATYVFRSKQVFFAHAAESQECHQQDDIPACR